MIYVVMDCETVPNEDVKWEPPKDKPDAFPPLPCHKIVTINTLDIGIAGDRVEIKSFGPVAGIKATEKEILLGFREHIVRTAGGTDSHVLVTWNGRGFDLPLYQLRSTLYGIPNNWSYDKAITQRFGGNRHYDLADILCNYGAAQRFKLDIASQMIGLPGKTSMEGSEVAQAYADGKLKDIRTYCNEDILQTALIFLKWMHNRGLFMEKQTNLAIREVLKAAGKKKSMKPLLSKIDESMLLQS